MTWSPEKTVVNSWNEWDPLKHVIVGRADDCHIPPEEPALPGTWTGLAAPPRGVGLKGAVA